ncbi:MAG TPA: sulfatase, partial [Opitutae bacterium]|nr:sulfatase [Opitutae bacterium]
MNTFSQLFAQKPGSLAAQDFLNRRIFLRNGAAALSAAALAGLLPRGAEASPFSSIGSFPNFAPKAKRVIYLFQSGGPSQMDLFDPKPMMEKERGNDLPESIRKGQRLTTMTSGQKSFPIAPSIFKFAQHGQSGQWMSELLPHLSRKADELCFIKSMHTEAINHDPAMTFFQTGHQLAGRPSFGSWVSYGLGASNQDLPSYVVLTSFGSGRPSCQPLYDRLWGAGFLPTRYQGVKFRNSGDAVLYLSDPPGIDRAMRRGMLDDLAKL